MKKVLATLVLFFCLMLPSGAWASESTSEPSAPPSAASLVHCGPAGKYIICTLLGEGIILRIPIPTITVPGPIIEVPVPTQVPGPTKTVTVTPNPVTATETPDAVTKTETVTEPGGTKTVTESPSTNPTSTVTTTETVDALDSGVIDNDDQPSVLFDPPPLTVTETVGYGALALLGMISLVLLGLWLAYVMGFKKSEREDVKFLDALRDQFYTGKHR